MIEFSLGRLVFGFVINLAGLLFSIIDTSEYDIYAEDKTAYFTALTGLFFVIGIASAFIATGTNKLTLPLFFILGIAAHFGNLTAMNMDKSSSEIEIDPKVHWIVGGVSALFILLGAFASGGGGGVDPDIQLYGDEIEINKECITNFGGPVIVQEVAEQLGILDGTQDVTLDDMPDICFKISKKVARNIRENKTFTRGQWIIIKDIINDINDNKLTKSLIKLEPGDLKTIENSK